MRYPPSTGSARTDGGPGRSPASTTPARRSPRARGGSHSLRNGLSATAATALWCCSHTKVVVRQPVSGVDRRGRRKQDLLGDPPGRVEHHRCGDRLPPPYVDALAALVEEVQGL